MRGGPLVSSTVSLVGLPSATADAKTCWHNCDRRWPHNLKVPERLDGATVGVLSDAANRASAPPCWYIGAGLVQLTFSVLKSLDRTLPLLCQQLLDQGFCDGHARSDRGKE